MYKYLIKFKIGWPLEAWNLYLF